MSGRLAEAYASSYPSSRAKPSGLWKSIKRDKYLYLMLIPVVAAE
ncbi:hypothetical protein [Paenibacillus hemerocallicola]|jgi:hypothetical protein|nr:hypothetical protein [Paenibacillus hemerocallicola]